jgi:hypothetical protein
VNRRNDTRSRDKLGDIGNTQREPMFSQGGYEFRFRTGSELHRYVHIGGESSRAVHKSSLGTEEIPANADALTNCRK